jgi:hypothetical protein
VLIFIVESKLTAKKPSVTQAHIDLPEKYVINIDQADRSTWMAAFSVPFMFRACVTLGFFNSVP